MNRFLKSLLLICSSLYLKAQVPTATIVAPGSVICSGSVYSFSTITSNSPTAYSWSVSPSSSVTVQPNTAGDQANISFPRGGIYLITLQVSNSTSLTVSTRTVGVTQSALASFNASLHTAGFPNSLFLTNYSTNQISNAWLFSDAPADGTKDVVKTYTASGNYSVSLIAFGNNMCNDTASYSFRIADSSGITLPNVFTPNNDSINDIFKPIARGILKMKAYVYNRYGTLIYNWDTVQGYWDGYTTSGEPCSSDVYFCVLEATGFDGKSYKLKTKVTLLR